MQYLTEFHARPPTHAERNDRLIPTAPLIASENTAALAELGIYPHVTEPGDAPFGYTDWVLIDGVYHREPAGTPEEREAASVAARRVELHARRRDRRTEAETGGFLFQGKLVDSDRDSIQRIAQATGAAGQAIIFDAPYSVAWTCADDTDLALDAAGVLALQAALAAHGGACHARSRALKALIDSAETLADLAAVEAELTTGWPEVVPT